MSLEPLAADLRERYLRHLGVARSATDLGAPPVELLRLLHRRHLDLVPYENLEIQLGRPTTITPSESVARILTGRGGYCYHLNGAFGALLVSLGFDVTLVRGAVPSQTEGRWGNHMVLLVRIDDGVWLADVGLGDGFRDPVPLVDHAFGDEVFRYRLSHVGGPRWRFDHDPKASISGFDLDVTPVGLDAFQPVHQHLSTSPESSFVQKLVVQRRAADHALTLRGCVLTRVDVAGKVVRDVTDAHEWERLLREEFRLRLSDVTSQVWEALWSRVRAAHEAWVRAGRSASAHPAGVDVSDARSSDADASGADVSGADPVGGGRPAPTAAR